MTEEEFKALLNIEGYDLQVETYDEKFWIASIIEKNTEFLIKAVSEYSRTSAVKLLCMMYYDPYLR